MSQSNKNEGLQVEADEKHLLLDHNYDGIQELNHPLPSWWSVLFYLGIIFAVAYTIYYQWLGGKSLRTQFLEDYEKIKLIQNEFKKKNGPFDPYQYAVFSTKEHRQAAETIYADNCLQCHKEQGRGDIGPNLTDKYWLLAKGDPQSIYNVVFAGSEENGMPAWGEVLSPDDIYRVVGYVMTFKNTNHPEGKAPQGQPVDE